MAQTPSTMLPLGSIAPDFTLPDPHGRPTPLLGDSPAAAYLVMFLCNHCPFVKHVRAEVARLGRDLQARGVRVVAVSSNDIVTHPADSPDLMAAEAAEAGYTFPYLYDESQAVAKAYRAACTPDFYLFDAQRRLVYRGQLDDSRPPTKRGGNDLPVTGADLRAAAAALLAGRPVSPDQKPSIGCNIKWKPGAEPDYFAA